MLNYTVKGVEFYNDKGTPSVVLSLGDFSLGPRDSSYVVNGGHKGGEPLYLKMDVDAVRSLLGLEWDGTPSRISELKKDLEGRVFEFDLKASLGL